MDAYQKVEKVGEGTYGVVYKALCKKTQKYVALKKVRLENDSEGIPSTSLREIALLKEVQFPNIVALLDIILEDRLLYLVFEFLSMDLKQYMEEEIGENQSMDVRLIQSYMCQTLQALLWCHRRRIIHRDLKPQNLLIDQSGLIKIADFGLARSLGIPIKLLTHEVVTLWYRAPEILLGIERYSYSIDIWSMACIFSEMFHNAPLFAGDSEIDQLFKIFALLTTPDESCFRGITALPDYQASYPKWRQYRLPEKCCISYNDNNNNNENNDNCNGGGAMPSDAFDLLEKMLVYDPVKRINSIDALKHPYFDSFDKEQLQGTALLKHALPEQMKNVAKHMEQYRNNYVKKLDIQNSNILGSLNK